VSFSSDPTFATMVSTPVAFSGFTTNTTNLVNLMPSTTYYVACGRKTAMEWSLISA